MLMKEGREGLPRSADEGRRMARRLRFPRVGRTRSSPRSRRTAPATGAESGGERGGVRWGGKEGW